PHKRRGGVGAQVAARGTKNSRESPALEYRAISFSLSPSFWPASPARFRVFVSAGGAKRAEKEMTLARSSLLPEKEMIDIIEEGGPQDVNRRRLSPQEVHRGRQHHLQGSPTEKQKFFLVVLVNDLRHGRVWPSDVSTCPST